MALCFRPSAIPGPIPDELIAPAAESIGMFADAGLFIFLKQFLCYQLELTCSEFLGVKLLLKMGWRHGRSIKDSSTASLQGMFCVWMPF